MIEVVRNESSDDKLSRHFFYTDLLAAGFHSSRSQDTAWRCPCSRETSHFVFIGKAMHGRCSELITLHYFFEIAAFVLMTGIS